MIYHLIEGHGQSGGVARHDIGCRVAYEDDVHTCLVDEFCHRIVIGGEHGYLLTLGFHLSKTACGDLA
jgi:hypothetical protein